jgi:hypothetical protein
VLIRIEAQTSELFLFGASLNPKVGLAFRHFATLS